MEYLSSLRFGFWIGRGRFRKLLAGAVWNSCSFRSVWKIHMNRSTLHLFQECEYNTSYYSIYCNVYNLHGCIDVLFHSKEKGKKMYTRIIYNRRHRKLQAKRQKRYATFQPFVGSRFIPAEEIRAPTLIFVKIPAILVHGRKTFPPDQSRCPTHKTDLFHAHSFKPRNEFHSRNRQRG